MIEAKIRPRFPTPMNNVRQSIKSTIYSRGTRQRLCWFGVDQGLAEILMSILRNGIQAEGLWNLTPVHHGIPHGVCTEGSLYFGQENYHHSVNVWWITICQTNQNLKQHFLFDLAQVPVVMTHDVAHLWDVAVRSWRGEHEDKQP